MAKKHLRILAKYTERTTNSDRTAVDDSASPEFFTHAANRMTPEVAGLHGAFGEFMFSGNNSNPFSHAARDTNGGGRSLLTEVGCV